MGRIGLQRDLITANQGYIRAAYVAVLCGVQRSSVFTWTDVKYVLIADARFYLWSSVREFQGPDACAALGLPEKAPEALQKALQMKPAKKPKAIAVGALCLAESPLGAKCTREPHTEGPHRVMPDGPEWDSPPQVKKKAAYAKDKATKVATTAKGAVKDPKVFEQELHAIEPDAIGQIAVGEWVRPQEHPLSLYLGNPLKKPAELIEALPRYSLHVPSYNLMGKRRWRCDRRIQEQPGVEPDWWQGEYVEHDGKVGIKWSKLLLQLQKKEGVPPPGPAPENATELQAAAEYTATDGVKAPPPPAPAPTITPVVQVPSALTTTLDPLLAVGMTQAPPAPAPPPLPPAALKPAPQSMLFPPPPPLGPPPPPKSFPPPPPIPGPPEGPKLAPAPPPAPPTPVEAYAAVVKSAVSAVLSPPPAGAAVVLTEVKTVAAAPAPAPEKKKLRCRVPTCMHEVDWHGPEGCMHPGCACKQAPPPNILASRPPDYAPPAAS